MEKKYINIDVEVKHATYGGRIPKSELEGMTEKEKDKYLEKYAHEMALDVFDYSVNISENKDSE
jgi:hypothetical protein